MSNAVLPSLPGLAWNIHKRPVFRTRVQRSVGGWETRIAQQMYPMWEFELPYEFLRTGGAYSELQTLMGFYLRRQGSYDDFLYSDPSDNGVTAQPFGTGDGATTAFQLSRSYGGFNEPVQNLNGAPLIYRNDWQGNQLQYATPRTNLVLYSEQLDNAAWYKGGVIVSANAAFAPDGSQNAENVITGTANSAHYVGQTVGGITAGANYTISVCFKAAAYGYAGISFSPLDNTTPRMTVNLTTGAIVGTYGTHAPTVYGSQSLGNGWWRFWMVVNSQTGPYQPAVYVHPLNAAVDPWSSFIGDGVSGVYMWGAQLESGNSPTAYIATTTAAVSVTDYTLNNTGLVTFAVPPLLGAALTWTGTYYYRVRFAEDNADFNNMMQNLWELKKLNFLGSPMNKV